MISSSVAHSALLLGIYISGAAVFPGMRWEERTPESQGVDPSIPRQATDYLHANSGGVGTAEVVIVRNGYVIWKGSDVENYHFICSCTKTFTTTVLGLLIEDGLIYSNCPKALPKLAQFL